ncbi:hypothetical protein OS190_01085 [Sulfitobacter sp. F26204]|uniref:hypothetical protein n=1 Tax=Sulfitobacter sp. F26204 TaxID=2996014 RepID=UPI00225DE1CC|nr:hypothetical protein [Sulfitobacter sp. F26204]MCX7558142.1 hypothetical protein [Sulfitobacter sp. F26204]
MRASAIVLMATLAMTNVSHAQGLDGLYKPDAEWADAWDCKSVGMDGGAMAIQDGVFFGIESECRMLNPTKVRDMDATLFDLHCSNESEISQMRIMILDTPEGIVTVRDGGDVTRYIRCE